MLVTDQDAMIGQWVLDRIPHANEFEKFTALGVATRTGKLIAGVVYNNWQPEYANVELSMAADNPMWAKRENITALLSYPFKQLGCYKVYTVTPIENVKALKVNAHIGFIREAILAHQFGKGNHAVVMRMLLPDFIRRYGES